MSKQDGSQNLKAYKMTTKQFSGILKALGKFFWHSRTFFENCKTDL